MVKPLVNEAAAVVLSVPAPALVQLPVTVSGIDSMKVLRQNLKVAAGFKPMSERQMNALRRRVQQEAADGRFELYKTSAKMEGPIGRKQHGFPAEEELSA